MATTQGKPLNQVTPPALPHPTGEYSRAYQDALNNVLRLYFSRVDSLVKGITSSESGAASLFAPHGVYYSAVDQTPASPDTAYPVAFETVSPDTTTLGFSVAGAGNDSLEVLYSGVYEVVASLQIYSSTSTSKEVTVWLERNGTAILGSAQRMTLAKQGYDQVLYHSTVEMLQGDVFKLVWAVSDTNMKLAAVAASSPYPAIPSASVSVTHLSNTVLEQ